MVESEITQDSNIPQTRRAYIVRVLGRRTWMLVLTALLIPIGCSKEERQKMATTIQQQTQSIAEKTQQYTQAAVEAVEEKLPAAGSITLRMDPPVEFSSATVQVVSLGPGRGNVIQISTYDLGAGPKTYPSLLIQGSTEAETVASLVTQTVSCDLYMRASNNDPMLMTGIGRPVEVNFEQFDAKSNTIKASIYSGSLVSSDNKKITLNGGNVIALINSGN